MRLGLGAKGGLGLLLGRGCAALQVEAEVPGADDAVAGAGVSTYRSEPVSACRRKVGFEVWESCIGCLQNAIVLVDSEAVDAESVAAALGASWELEDYRDVYD